MAVDPRIEHLDDDDVISPFDVLIALDTAIGVARVAHTHMISRLLYDAVRDDAEAAFAEAMSHLWAARLCLKESVS